MTRVALLVFAAMAAWAEVKTLTLKQVIELAMEQNPDLALARLDQQRARDGVHIARDPFTLKMFAGSGLAWTTGFPGTIEGSAPSIIQARAIMSLYNRPQSYQVAQANEAVRSAEVDVLARQDEVAFRAASLYLEAEQAARNYRAVQRQIESLGRVRDAMGQRVAEGRELEIENKKAHLALLKARQRAEALAMEMDNAETALALALGMEPVDRVRPAQEERTLGSPGSEGQSVESALEHSRELRRLESQIQSKNFEIQGYRAWRLPKVDLVAQYALFARYNNYEDFFRKFSRNNAQLGAAITLPVFAGSATRAYAAQTEIDLAKLRSEVARTRNRITVDTRRLHQELKRAETAREVARADLDVAREQLSINLAQFEEGRLPLAKVEEARVAENEKWMAFYDAQHAVERVRLSLLRQTGTLLAALK